MSELKFSNKYKTLKDEDRAYVDLKEFKTLWFNTGTRCNLSCDNCYIESNPTNDRLVFIDESDVSPYLKEIADNNLQTELIGLTGGEPFLNGNIINILSNILDAGIECLVLTNAFRAIDRFKKALQELKEIHGNKLHLRISLDHYTKELHESERGPKTFDRTLENIKWLYDEGFNISIAGRTLKDEDLENSRKQYQLLLESINVHLNLTEKLVVFPEMDMNRDVPEITTACWDILDVSPSSQMCASERMIVKRKNETKTTVLPCTLLAYDEEFNLGHTLLESEKRVYLNHKFCAQFCVLGGASCSSAK